MASNKTLLEFAKQHKLATFRIRNTSWLRIFLYSYCILMVRTTTAQTQDISSPSIYGNYDVMPTAFYCPAEGLFADDYDCQIYYRCETKTNDYIKPYMFACKEGTVFSRDLKLCMPPSLAGREECEHYMNEIDTDSGDDSNLMYGIANNGNAMLHTATHNQLQNYGLTGLNGVSVISFSTSSSRSSSIADDVPVCEYDGFMSDPDDCTVFYRCISNGRSYNRIGFRCSDGTAWDESLQSCNHIYNVGGCEGKSNVLQEQYAGPAVTQTSQTANQNSTSSSNQQQSSSSSTSTSSSSSSSSQSNVSNNNQQQSSTQSSNTESSSSSSTNSQINASNSNNQGSDSAEAATTVGTNGSTNNQSSQNNQQTSNSNNASVSNSSNSHNSSNNQNGQSSNSPSNSSNIDTSNPTKCQDENTYFSHKDDCTKFYRCRATDKGGLEKVPFTCGPGTVWHQQQKACDLPSESQKESCKLSSAAAAAGANSENASSTTNNQQTIESSGSNHTSSSNQSQGGVSSTSQSNQSVANQSSSSSNQSETQTSGSQHSGNQISSANQSTNNNAENSVQSSLKPSTPDGVCTDNETYLPDTTNCARFYRCVDNGINGFNKVPFDCAPGTVWDQDLKACNYPTNVQKEQCRSMAAATSTTSSSSQNGASQQSSSSSQNTTNSGTTQGSINNQQSTSSQATGSNQGSSNTQNTASNQSTSSSQNAGTSQSSNNNQQSSSGQNTGSNQGSNNSQSSASNQGSSSNENTGTSQSSSNNQQSSSGQTTASNQGSNNSQSSASNQGSSSNANTGTSQSSSNNQQSSSGQTTGSNQGSNNSQSSASNQGSSSNANTGTSQSSSNNQQSSSGQTTGSNQGSNSSQSSTSNQSSNSNQNTGVSQSSSNHQESSSAQATGTNEGSNNSQSSASNQGSSSNQNTGTSQGSSNNQQSISSQNSSISQSSASNQSTSGGQSSNINQGSGSSQNSSNNNQGLPQRPSTPPEHCENESNFLPNKEDCSKFYRCVNDGKGGFTKVSFSCPSGTVWDPQATSCNYPSAVHNLSCKMGTATSSSSSSTVGSSNQQNSQQSSGNSNNNQTNNSSTQSSTGTNQTESSSTTSASQTSSSSSTESNSSSSNNQSSNSNTSQGSGSSQSSGSNQNSNNNQQSSQSQSSNTTQQTSNKPISSSNQISSSVQGAISHSKPSGHCDGKTEFLGDENDCAKFYRCVDSGKGVYIKVAFSCAPGTVWDSQIAACNYAWSVHNKKCGTGSIGILQPQKPITQVPPPSGSLTTTSPLPQNTTQTVKPSTAKPITTNLDPTQEPIPSGSSTQEPINTASICKAEGFTGDPKDCSIFYRCVGDGKGGFTQYPFKCGDGTVWDNDLQTCNHDWKMCNINTSGSPTSELQELSHTTPHPTEKPAPITMKPAQGTQIPGYRPTTTRPTENPAISTIKPTEQGSTTWQTTTTQNPQSSTQESGKDPVATTNLPNTTTNKPLPPKPITSGAKCTQEGFFGDDKDCKKFYRCVDNGTGDFEKFTFTCGNETVWDADIEGCNHPTSVQDPRCRQEGTTVIGIQETTTTNGDYPTTTNKYETSANPILPPTTQRPDFTTTRQPTTLIESTTNAHVTTTGYKPTSESTTNEYITTVQTTSPPTPNLPPGTNCNGEGFMADPSDCRKFYRCVKSGDKYIRHEFTCATGTGWSEITQTCDHATNIDRCEGLPTASGHQTSSNYDTTTTSIYTSTFPITTSAYEKPTVTTTPYYEAPTTNRYPTTSSYDTTTLVNDISTTNKNPATPQQQQTGQTGYKPTTTTVVPSTIDYTTMQPTSVATPIPNLPPGTTCTGEGFMADPNNCQKFYRCIKSGDRFIKHKFVCAKGTGWSEEKQTCDYAGNIDRCYGQTENPATTSIPYDTTTVPTTTTHKTSTDYDMTKPTASIKPTTEISTIETTTIKPQPTTTITTIIPPTSKPTTAQHPSSDKPSYQTTTTTDYSISTSLPTTEDYLSTTMEPITHVCTMEGFFPDAQDCNRYYRCVDTNKNGNYQVYSFRCPSSTVWDTSVQTCNYVNQVLGNCSSGATTPMSGSSGTTEIPTSTTIFVQPTSKPEEAKPMETFTTIKPETTTIPASSTQSTSGLGAASTEAPATGKPTTQQESFSNSSMPCPQTSSGQNIFICPTGFRRHPKSCDMFYQCAEKPDSHDMSIVAFKCPNGTVYHEQRNLCDKPVAGDRCLQQSMIRTFYDDQVRRMNMIQIRSQTSLCPAEGHFALNNDDCGQIFVKCRHSMETGRFEGQIYRCPQGFAYWSVSRRCERAQKLMNCTPTKYDIDSAIPVEWTNIGNRRRNLDI